MKIIWCKNLEDVVTAASGHGWLFHLAHGGSHYYYVYAGVESELLCMLVRCDSSVAARYVTINDDGELKTSERPIMPACARIIEVTRDEKLEEALGSR
ncbi:MAG: hypothetical protein QXG10_02150 [Candidatus Hadarchaeales archaeon]